MAKPGCIEKRLSGDESLFGDANGLSESCEMRRTVTAMEPEWSP